MLIRLSSPNRFRIRKSERITIAILIKLLAIKIVANRFLGLFRSFKTRLLETSSSLLKLSKSFGDKEKKATSEPETKAEPISSKIKLRHAKPMAQGLSCKKKKLLIYKYRLEGSGSKIDVFVKSYAIH